MLMFFTITLVFLVLRIFGKEVLDIPGKDPSGPVD
jgi:hypothetical protein